jgi:predicted DNA binding CopG/RHH family protein
MKAYDKMIKSVSIRIPIPLLEQVKTLAHQHDRSLNGEILTALREYTDKYSPKGKKT